MVPWFLKVSVYIVTLQHKCTEAWTFFLIFFKFYLVPFLFKRQRAHKAPSILGRIARGISRGRHRGVVGEEAGAIISHLFACQAHSEPACEEEDTREEEGTCEEALCM